MKWLTRTEVCEKTRLSYVTIWQMLKAGDFPRGRNVRGKILWKESDVDAWLESQPRQTFKGDGNGHPLGSKNLIGGKDRKAA